MKNLFLCSISAIVLSLCITQGTLAADTTVQRQTSQQTQRVPGKRFGGSYSSKPQKAEPVVVPKAKSTKYKELITEAVVLHNFIGLIDDQIAHAKEFEYAVKDKELDKARLADYEACQIKSLSAYFKDPEKVWEKLKSEADEKIQEYNATTVERAAELEESIASMVSLSDEEKIALLEAEKNKSHDNDPDTFEDDFNEMNAEWKIGYSILNSFYANQDEWAERKTAKTHSLPLWEDQKYLYNKTVWQPKYEEIVTYCKAQKVKLLLTEPTISDEYKYDYYFYDKVESAHENFVKQATLQGCVLTPQMKKAPKVAPRPLPPVEEEVLIVERPTSGMQTEAPHTSVFEKEDVPVISEDTEVVAGIYPQNPKNPDPDKKGAFLDGTLWEEYKKNDFEDVLDSGEFREYFNSSLEVSDKARDSKDNRLSMYLGLKTALENSGRVYESFLEERDEITVSFDSIIQEYGLDINPGINYLDIEELQKFKDALAKKKKELLEKAKAEMGDEADTSNVSTEEMQKDTYKAMLAAMEADEEGIVLLTRDTAVSIDDSLKESEAEKVLTSTYSSAIEGLKQSMLKEKNHKASEDNCLNFNGDALIDLSKVKIE